MPALGYCFISIIIKHYTLLEVKGLCDVYKGILTMEVLHACSSCFAGALANDLWQALFHSLQNVIRLLNIA